MKKLVVSLLSLLLWFNPLFSQELTYQQMGMEDGLPHYYTEYVFEDSKGFLWIGTVGGLAKYDGVNMEVFTTEDGLLSNNIITITEDKNQAIWVGTDNSITKITDRIKSYKLTKKGQGTKKILITSDNQIFAANLQGTFVYNEKLDSFLPHPIMGQFYTRTLIEDNNHDIWFGGIDGLYKTQEDTVVQVIIPGPNKNYHNSIVSSLMDRNGDLWFGTGSGFACYSSDTFQTFDQKLGVEYVYIKLNQLQDSSFLFGTYGGGIVAFKTPKNFTRTYLGDSGITENTVHGIEQTREGIIWLATGSNLLKSKKKGFEVIDVLSNQKALSTYEIVQNYQGDLWMATNQGVLVYEKKSGKQTRLKVSEDPQENNVISLFADHSDSSVYVGTYSGICFRYKNGQFHPFGNESDMVRGQAIFGIYKDSKKNVWISKNVRVLKCSENKVEEVQLDSIHDMFFEVLEDKNNRYWFATSNGLYLKEADSVTFIESVAGKILGQTRQLEIDRFGVIWLGTYSGGVYSYDPETREGKHYSRKNGLTSDFIQSLKYDKQRNCLWIGTINGISIIQLDENPELRVLRSLKSDEPLSCNVNSIFCDSAIGVLIGVGNKLYRYGSLENINNQNIPRIGLNSIEIFNSPFDFSGYSDSLDKSFIPQGVVLPHDKNQLTFHFYGIEFNQPEGIIYSFKLAGFEENWQNSQSSFVTYNNLPPGSYCLLLKAKNSDGFWSDPYEYQFRIDSPFYQKYWFVFGVGFFLVLSFSLFIKNRIKKIKRKAEIEKNIAQLELKALRAQMNPHFIFNIMNNIQNFVVTKQAEKAVGLLGDFAKLIRSILDISSEKTILLSQEIDFLKTYIELDLSQYPGKYRYEFDLPEELDTDNVLIPPVLIQPFVENAILHGLMHRENLGVLTISFRLTATSLICVVEDNGVGRVRSKELSVSNPGHKSKALNISNDRINQFNKLKNSSQFAISISDVLDGNNKCIGTRAKIEMPLQLKY